MRNDNLYIFNKNTLLKELLGEVQNDFNMSFVIDGTKDSWACVIKSNNGVVVEPYTISYHEKTNTWWVITKDNVERHMNESGFYYIHNLQLLGAIELLNARDLTDCGFNSNKYTVRQFLTRLISLSNFEFETYFFDNDPLLDRKVEFIKTFENYTLLSAMRELLDSFNYSIRLEFFFGVNNVITYANFVLIPKTGDFERNILDISTFDEIKETKEMNKESFGTSVISNAENVVSSVAKTYPTIGGVKNTAHEHVINGNNAIIKLPSKVFKANWLALVPTIAPIRVYVKQGTTHETYYDPSRYKINVLDEYSKQKGFDKIIDDINQYFTVTYDKPEFAAAVIEELEKSKDYILEKLKLATTIKIFADNDINAYTGEIVKGKNVPYLTRVQKGVGTGEQIPLAFFDKDTKNCLNHKYSAISWERGSDEISGFDLFTSDFSQEILIRNLLYTDLQVDAPLWNGIAQVSYSEIALSLFDYGDDVDHVTVGISGKVFSFKFQTSIQWVVNYIPMADIKTKVDNTNVSKDIQLYNQNGKLTDSVALSKLINSYSKEISNETITRSKIYYDFDEVPQVGTIVQTDNEYFVINNVSLTFVQNEDNNIDEFGYQIDAEITMSKYCSTKSLMVSPNTNIRDYGIPQNYNVKRKQLYRDYYEFNYSYNEDNEAAFYLKPTSVFQFDLFPNNGAYLTCLIRLTYDNPVEESLTWYYQLETTNYYMNKMLYVVLDFTDNNIIGYSSQNAWSGFVLSRVFTGMTDLVATPISYTDSNGEFKRIDILYCNNEELTFIYDEYVSEHYDVSGYDDFLDKGGTLYNYSLFIPEEIYTKANNGIYSMYIVESDYKKDAIEVPVFEYGCQVNDTKEVLIGDGILNNYSGNYIYLYSYIVGTNLTQDNATTNNSVVFGEDSITIYDGVDLTLSNTPNANLKISLRSSIIFNELTLETNSVGTINFIENKDYAFFRHVINLDTHVEEKVELIFIAKNVPNSAINQQQANNYLSLKINHYKLK